MTFTMLPIGRSVFRPRLHRTLPVAALAKAAPVTWMPTGPPTTAGAACLAETDSPAEAACVRRRGSRDRGGPRDRAGLAGRMDLEGHARMRAASVGRRDGGARYQQGHHDGKENPDCMPG